MGNLIWKTRIAVLWILAAVVMSAHIILVSIDPAAMEKTAEWAAKASQGEWVFSALFWLVPMWMALVVLTLKGSANRWINFIVAIIFTIFNIWHFFICGVPLLKGGAYTEPTVHHILLVASSAVATALIAWFAWKRLKQKE